MEPENEEEILAVDNLIAGEEELQQVLLKKLNASYDRKKELLTERLKLTGKDLDDYSDLAIPDLLEMIFQKFGKQHITQAAALLKTEFGRSADTQTISGALFRYAKKGERFKKVGKNTFNLIDVDVKDEVQDMKNENIN